MSSVDVPHRDCIVMLTHHWDARLARHYARLKREAGRVADVYLALQVRNHSPPLPDVPNDLTISLADAKAVFPLRHAQHAERGRSSVMGFVDLLWLTMFLGPELSAYDRFWLIEYDVDFSGDWALFFGEAATYEEDLLVSHLVSRRDHSGWAHMPTTVDPLDRPDDQLIGFFPVSRFSRALVEHFRQELAVPGWQGHFELILPTLARRGGFKVGDFGGRGEFVLPDRRDKFYDGYPGDGNTAFHTHGFRPPRAQHYYVESPSGFWARNKIFHPIKTRQRIRGKISNWLRLVRDRVWFRLAQLLGYEPRAKPRR